MHPLRIKATLQQEGDLHHHIESLQVDYRNKASKAADELKRSNAEIERLKKEVIVLKDSTLIGEKQKELDKEKMDNKETLHLLEHMRVELEAALSDKDLLSHKILEMETTVEQRVADRVVAEREKNIELEQDLKRLRQRFQDETEKMHALEEEMKTQVRKVDELENWKSIYESGHGLQELARNQKKLKDDNRRLGVAVEQMTSKLGMVMDVNGILAQAFDKLKLEAGKPADFMYEEYALQEEMLGDNARLKAQNLVLEEQLGSLEEENIKLRMALKNQAGSFSAEGFKYAGMTAEQLVKVNEFAASVRDGRIELPLNDRSSELLKVNRGLQDDINALKAQMLRLEREVGGSGGGGVNSQQQQQQMAELLAQAGGSMSRKAETELFGLRNDVARLLHENGDLHERMTRMQAEVGFAVYVNILRRLNSLCISIHWGNTFYCLM